MRDIVSPLDGFRSPFGPRRGFSPVNAIRQRDGSAIRDRAGNFIEVRA